MCYLHRAVLGGTRNCTQTKRSAMVTLARNSWSPGALPTRVTGRKTHFSGHRTGRPPCDGHREAQSPRTLQQTWIKLQVGRTAHNCSHASHVLRDKQETQEICRFPSFNALPVNDDSDLQPRCVFVLSTPLFVWLCTSYYTAPVPFLHSKSFYTVL